MSGLTPLAARTGIQVRELTPGVTPTALANATQKNGQTELVVRSGNRDLVVYGEQLRPAGGGKLPEVGDKVKLTLPGRTSPIEGTVTARSREKGLAHDQKVALIVGGTMVAGAAVGMALTRGPSALTGNMVADLAIGIFGRGLKMGTNMALGMGVGLGVGGAAAWLYNRSHKPSDEQLKAISTAVPR